ncbi:MAG: helix-turn-helix transcriptional regulator [Proteobacteria bacterium]|nr:helix-turn-helix transcriptional regulator [Pseudomonadota bacterium]MDA0993773.1 helix-turn-helix transcriptional regulator [Pseudomonadota bacterium]
MTDFSITDEVFLAAMGRSIARQRIDSGLTQSELAGQAGVSRSTVERLEAGRSTQTMSLVRILRVLGLLEQFGGWLPGQGPRPMELLKNKRRERQRASSRRSSADAPVRDWRWGDES